MHNETRCKDDLVRLVEKKERVKYLFFWGHRKRKDGRVGNSCFSQWYPAHFEVDEAVYSTAEHFMMAEKARLFGDHEGRRRILRACAVITFHLGRRCIPPAGVAKPRNMSIFLWFCALPVGRLDTPFYQVISAQTLRPAG